MTKTVRSIIAVLLVAVLSFAMLALVVGAEGEAYSADFKDDSGKIIALVSSQNDVFGSAELVVNEVSQAYDGFNSQDGYRKVLYAVEMSFVENEIVKVFSDETFTVKLRVPKAMANEESILVYSLNSAGFFVPVTATVTDGYAVFTASNFSTFALAIAADAPVPFVNPDYTWIWVLVWILVILLILGVIALLIVRYIKKKKEEFDSMAPTRRSTAPTAPVEAENSEEETASESTPLVEDAAEESEPEVVVAVETTVDEPENAEPAAPVEESEPEVVVAVETTVDEPETAEPAAPVEESEPEVVVAVETTVDEPENAEPASPAEEPEVVVVSEVEAEPPKPVININFVDEAEKDAGVPGAAEAVSVRFRTSFESRYIQSGVLQDYYTAIKNLLLSYKGVKARTSWNHESFNKGRQQCAKINIKGNALLVYLALDPANYNVKKYHFNDMSSKPKFDGTPMLMKVKSERALKYTLELIAEMMNVLEIPAGKAVSVDYHAPFETTEALAARGLVKIILPAGATLGDNLTAFKANVGAILEAEKSE